MATSHIKRLLAPAQIGAHPSGAVFACFWCYCISTANFALKQFKQLQKDNMDALKQGSDALFILLGGIMVLAMHAGFAFLELGTVRKKNQVNALVKILADLRIGNSTA
jgi:hypothetical protein